MQLDPLEAYSLDLNGFVVVKQAFDPGLTRRLATALERLEQLPDAERAARCRLSWTPVVNEMRVLNLLDTDPAFAEIVDHPAILDRVRAVVPGPQRVVESYSITRGKGIGLPLHAVETARYHVREGRPQCDMITAVVNLTDCGPEDGPFVVFAGTHKLGVPWPFSPLHPSWPQPAHDVAHSSAAIAATPERTRHIAWEDIPGYREMTVQAGDLILFVQSLWHGAKQLRSGKVRRTLYCSYSPYHFCNWHGLQWSDELRARATPAQRALLAGPFIGQRYPSFAVADLPDEFTTLPDSELGARRIADVAAPAPAPPGDADAALRFVTDRLAHLGGPILVPGDCQFAFAGPRAAAWTVSVGQDGIPRARAGASPSPQCVVEVDAGDLAAALQDGAEVLDLWQSGRLRVRGNVALAMQIASHLLG